MRRFFVAMAAIAILGVPVFAEGEGVKSLRPVRDVAPPKPVSPARVVERLFVAPGFEDVVVFATNSIAIDRDDNTTGGAANITGDVVANDASTGPTLNSGFEVSVGKDVEIGGNVQGDSVELGKNSSVSLDVVYNDLSKASGVSIGGSELTPLTVPVFPIPAFQVAAPELGADKGDADSPLKAGLYGDLSVTTSMVLDGGVYDFGSVSVASGATLSFDGPSEVRVGGRLSAGSGSTIAPNAGVTAGEVIFFVGGENGGDGSPGASPAAVDIGQQSTLSANVYAPNGRIQIDKQSSLAGSFAARDVKFDRGVVATLDSFWTNEPPIAFPQEVQTDGANELVITLEGIDPEGGNLTFSIEVDPAEGTIIAGPTPINPASVQQCSVLRNTCIDNNDCGLGETCETVQPPITQATVTYEPVAANCVTEPSSGEVTCPEDFFTFGVTDIPGDLGTAIVSINGGTDEAPGDPEPGVDTVEANDSELDAVVNQVRTITLSAAAPDTVASLTFRVETLPTGALQDSLGATVAAGVDLPSPVLTYQAPATMGSDPFTFSARDSSTSAPPCGPPSCDTGTVNIDVGNLPELAPDQSVGTDLNQPVEITLRANPGGAAGGTAATFPTPISSSLITKVTYNDNGPAMTSDQIGRIEERLLGDVSSSATALGVDTGWFQFGWCDIATSPGCNDLVDLVNESPADVGPFDFTTTADSCLRVTDTLAKGDHWRVETSFGGGLDWTDFTSEVPQSTVGTTSDPDVAFGDLSYSHGAFDLVGGVYSVDLITIPPDSFAFGTAGYIRVDTGPCIDIVWTVTSLPANGTLTNLNGSPVQIGDTYTSTPTVVFTPTFNFSGSTTFAYSVTEGGTLGQNVVVDTAIIDILISSNDPCVLVGRAPGCTPGGS